MLCQFYYYLREYSVGQARSLAFISEAHLRLTTPSKDYYGHSRKQLSYGWELDKDRGQWNHTRLLGASISTHTFSSPQRNALKLVRLLDHTSSGQRGSRLGLRRNIHLWSARLRTRRSSEPRTAWSCSSLPAIYNSICLDPAP